MLNLFDALDEVRRGRGRSASTQLGKAVQRLTASILDCANHSPVTLTDEINRAITDTVSRLDEVSIAVTGLAWLGSGVPSVEQQMLALVRGAQREINLCVYSVTWGATPLLREVKEVVNQGVKATLVVNSFERQRASVRRYLRRLARERHSGWRVLDFSGSSGQTDLHAKLLIVDRAAALVGSANLSFHGMVTNHEIAVIVRGPTAEMMAERFDMLTRSASARPVS